MEAMATAATGNVYVFNQFSEVMTLSINGMTIAGGDIPGWGQSGANRYQPSSQAVPRTLNASDGPRKFFNGKNQLTIQWSDGLSGAVVQIDGNQFPLFQDLILTITRNSWQLVNAYGVTVESGQVIGAGALAASEEAIA